MGNFRYRLSVRVLWLLVAYFPIISFSYGQVSSQEQEVLVSGLPALMAVSHDPVNVLLTSLDTTLHDQEICCGKDSALEDTVMAADSSSLKEVGSKLGGRHLLSDGRPINVKTEYLSAKEISGGHLIEMLRRQHAALMQWNSGLYVVHGATYFWVGDNHGGMYAQLHKLLLWDTRYSDARRQVTYTVESDDGSKVEGFLFIEASRP